MKLGEKNIGLDFPPLIVAEMSGNHNQSLDRALKIVEEAAKAGVHALKLQTYTADTMTLDLQDGDFFISDEKSLWKGNSLHQLYQKAHTPREWHKPLFDRCRDLGIIPFSTPFDGTAVDFLESLEVSFYKVASFENGDLPLIRKIGATKKPMIISTGMATLAELEETIETARKAGCPAIILLKCTSNYPADPADSNIASIPHMRALFNCEVGLSDHTLGIGAAIASIAFGATLIEKHFTLSRDEGGVDAAFSLEPNEMRLLVEESERAWKSLGKIVYGPSTSEKSSLRFRRSLYIGKDMKAGEIFTPENLRIIRPGFGLSPKFHDVLLGKVLKKPAKKGTPVTWELIL